MRTELPTSGMPQFLSVSGHPVRWRLISELASSDRHVGELVALVGEKQSLTSYHLGQLRRGGLVHARRSSGDGRETYYSLDLIACRDRMSELSMALHPGLHAPAGSLESEPVAGPDEPPVRVLFLCTGNSARSQMAAGILEHIAGDRVEVASAGSHPKALHPEAVRVMQERGIDISGRRPTHVDELSSQHFDHVVSLCDRVREECPDFPDSPTVAHWSIPDPSAETDPSHAMVRTANALTTRIEFFVHAMRQQRNLERN